MNFYIKYGKENITSLARKIGYSMTPYSLSVEGEYNFVKRLSNNYYPRFHIYIKKDDEKASYLFNLHLDQKKVSYRGQSAHSGEYDGEIIEREMERIKRILN